MLHFFVAPSAPMEHDGDTIDDGFFFVASTFVFYVVSCWIPTLTDFFPNFPCASPIVWKYRPSFFRHINFVASIISNFKTSNVVRFTWIDRIWVRFVGNRLVGFYSGGRWPNNRSFACYRSRERPNVPARMASLGSDLSLTPAKLSNQQAVLRRLARQWGKQQVAQVQLVPGLPRSIRYEKDCLGLKCPGEMNRVLVAKPTQDWLMMHR